MRGTIIVIVMAFAVTRCQVSPEEDGTPPPQDISANVAEASPSENPPTAPLALRMWLEQQHYRDTWELWPGTEPLHPGVEPHGALHTTWLSPSAMDALERGLPLPTGAVVLLGEHTADSLAAALDVMIQMEGSKAEGQAWLFARFGSAGEIEPTATCANCHVSEPDWIFSGEIGIPLPVDSTGAIAAPGPS